VAIGATVGAVAMWPVPGAVVGIAVVVALTRRTWLAFALAAAVLCSFLGSRALAGLDPPDAGPVDTWVTLTSDPHPFGAAGMRAGARWDGHRVSIAAHGRVASHLDDALAGEQLRIAGRFRPVTDRDGWARWRHEVGTISVDAIFGSQAGSPVTRMANRVRRVLGDGAAELDRDDRAIFLGMVIGDDRAQSAVTADDFRAAGLGHLLVVSGQNVAFVIAVLMPLVGRFRPGSRLVVLFGALAFFALLTRFEPSVLRAVAMAGVALGAAAMGTPVDGRRGLSVAVATLVVIDPFLVHVLAFRLSVAATAGIVWCSQPLAAQLRGPSFVRTAAATTIAAQLAVSPLLVFTFGPLPLASLPANLLAGPASGPIMVWGCTAGLLAGVAGGPVAELVHWPTEALVTWVRWVAHRSALAPAAMLGPVALLVTAGGVVGLVCGGRRSRLCALATLGVVVGAAIAAVPEPPQGRSVIGAGVTSIVSGGFTVLVLDDPHRPDDVVERVRKAGVRRVDAIVATDGDAADAFAVVSLVDRYGTKTILAPPMHRVPGASTVQRGTVRRFAGLVVRLQPGDEARLVVCPAGTTPCNDGVEEVAWP